MKLDEDPNTELRNLLKQTEGADESGSQEVQKFRNKKKLNLFWNGEVEQKGS